MEGALLAAGKLAGLARDDLMQSLPEVEEEAFDSDLKMMATIHRWNDRFLVAVKGAPESVIAAANSIVVGGETQLFSGSNRDFWLAKAAELAVTGLRVLALASKTVDNANDPAYQNLTFLGLVGLHDPPREGVGAAIEVCKRAGIGVVMVTGDHAVTAAQIARTVGLADEESLAPCEGGELGAVTALSDAERERLLHIPVFARVSPRQKLDLISLYQSSGAVVAMTGDGVNDAPALRQADIGIAMGKRGSQVAREAADVVLQDDAFESIVAAIAQGRVIFSNIRKFILYLLSCNLSEIMIVGLASVSGMPLPILPLQILYLNLVTDVFPAFALGAGEGEKNVMDSPPRDPKEALLPLRL
jgi:Ca2+-transporting ATPase